MMIQTTVGVPMDAAMLNNYFRTLVNLFFKILPIKESGESSLEVYMRSLQAELLGCKELIEAIHDDPLLLSYARMRSKRCKARGVSCHFDLQ